MQAGALLESSLAVTPMQLPCQCVGMGTGTRMCTPPPPVRPDAAFKTNPVIHLLFLRYNHSDYLTGLNLLSLVLTSLMVQRFDCHTAIETLLTT